MQIEKMLSTEGGSSLRDLQNYSHHTNPEFNNCFIIHLKYF